MAFNLDLEGRVRITKGKKRGKTSWSTENMRHEARTIYLRQKNLISAPGNETNKQAKVKITYFKLIFYLIAK